jgi:hypothetical protein
MNLKKVKQPPLLGRTEQDPLEWMKMRAGDVEAINKNFKNHLGLFESDGLNMIPHLEFVHNMRTIELKAEFTDEHEKRAREMLDARRSVQNPGSSNGLDLIKIHIGLRRLGRESEITKPDKEIIEAQRIYYRDESDNVFFQTNLAEILVLMKEAEMIEEVDEADKKVLRKWVENLRSRGESNGNERSTMHNLMRKLGIQEEVTYEDQKAMEKALTQLREDPDAFMKGINLALMLSNLKNFNLQEPQGREDIPPLKKIQD